MTQSYSYDEALKASLEYFDGDNLAAEAFVGKYALRNEEDELLEKTPEDMHRRLANEFSRIERKYDKPLSYKEILELFDRFRWVIPQGSPMSGIGNDYKVQTLGNCYTVNSPEDSYGGILFTDQQLAQLMKRRAGVGLDISTLRPKGFSVANSARTTDGIGVFMERYSNTCREVAQNGRRGALIITLNVHHPEIMTFINIKKNLSKVTGANISVRFTDEFMKALRDKKEYELRFPVDSKTPQYSTFVSAQDVWDSFIESNWICAEPGAQFVDNMNNNSPSHCYGKKDKRFYNITTNPCGEIVMGIDSCRLMAINLFSFIYDKFTDKATFDFEKLFDVAYKAQRLMDDMVDLELEKINNIIDKIKKDPEPEHVKKIELDMWLNYKETCELGRRTGLGIVGLGDAIAALGFKYGDDESIKLTEKIYKTLNNGAYSSTISLAKERGSFPLYDYNIEKNNKFIKKSVPKNRLEDYKKYGRRNIALLTTAPTGTVSLLCQTSSGIEPVFMVKYKRRRKINPSDKNAIVDFVDDSGDKWQEYTVFHHKYLEWTKISGLDDFSKSPYCGATVSDINWEKSVDIQSVAQKWVCHSISKTCNVPENCSKELISKVYKTAHKKGCKGFTVYRAGSRSGVLIEDKEEADKSYIVKTDAPKRPKKLNCDVYHIQVTKRLDKPRTFDYLVLVGLLNDEPYEVFVMENGSIPRHYKSGVLSKIKRGQYKLELDGDNKNKYTVDNILDNTTEFEDSLTRLTSTSLRHGVDISYVVQQLEKATGDMWSFSKAVSRALKKYIKEGTRVTGETCEKCNSNNLVRTEGCISCLDCGQSKCG